MVFTGIDFLINLNGCISVYKKKKEGELAEAGMELMVSKIANSFLLRCSAHTSAHPGAQSQRVPRADCAYLLHVLLSRRLLWTECSSHRLESCAQLD